MASLRRAIRANDSVGSAMEKREDIRNNLIETEEDGRGLALHRMGLRYLR